MTIRYLARLPEPRRVPRGSGIAGDPEDCEEDMPPLSLVGSREGPSYFGAEGYLELLKQCLTAAIYPESANRVLRADRRPGLKPRIRSMILRALARRGYIMQRVRPFDAAARNNGTDWPSIGYSMIGLQRMNNLQECVERVITNEVAGDLVEAGVWRGGAVILMLAVLRSRGVTDRSVWAADSFCGPAVSVAAAGRRLRPVR